MPAKKSVPAKKISVAKKPVVKTETKKPSAAPKPAKAVVIPETAIPIIENPDPAVGPVKKKRLTFRFKRSRGKASTPWVPVSKHKLASPYQLFIQAFKIPLQHWEVFGGILLIFGLLNAVLIGGLSSVTEIVEAKTTLKDVFTGQFSQLSTGLTLFGFLATSQADNAASGVAGAYSSLLLLVASLAIIYALRMVYGGRVIRIREAFYSGMTPFIPSILTLLVVGLQVAPAAIGVQLYSMVTNNGVLQGLAELGFATFILLLLCVASIYMLCSSLFALYIITLPNVTPLDALHSAKQLVQRRRAKIFIRLLALVVGIVLLAALIMVPVALLLTPAAPFVFYILSVIGLVLIHSYMYSLYRELLVD